MEDTNDRVFEALLIDWWELFGPGHELQLTTTHEDAAVRLSFTGLGYEPRKWDAGQWPRYVEAFVLLLTASHVNPRAFRHLVLLRCHLHVPSRRMETDAFIPCYLELSATEDSTWPREAITALLTRCRSRNASNAFKCAMAKLLALVDDPELRRECEELVIPVRLKLGYSMTEYHIDMLSSLVSRTQSNQDDQDVVFRLDSVDIYIMMHTASQPLVETLARCKGLPLGAVALPYPDDTEENRRRFSQLLDVAADATALIFGPQVCEVALSELSLRLTQANNVRTLSLDWAFVDDPERHNRLKKWFWFMYGLFSNRSRHMVTRLEMWTRDILLRNIDDVRDFLRSPQPEQTLSPDAKTPLDPVEW